MFFNLSLNFAKRSSWSKPQLAPGLVFADCTELLHLWLQSLISVLTIWWCPCAETGLVLLEEGVFFMTSMFFGKTVSLSSSSFCTPRPNKPRQHIKKQRYHFANKGLCSQSYGFSSSHVWIWELPRRLSTEELMLLNCCAGEDSWDSLG